MPVRYVSKPPQDVLEYDHEKLSAENVAEVAEIFQTPLQGSYAWDYDSANEKIRRLYRLGKLLNWNAEIDLDWSQTYPKTARPMIDGINPFEEYPFYSRISDAEKLRFGWHSQAWTLSQFLHGEQGALLVASQLVSCAPTLDAKKYAASQTFDEARHVEVFGRYLREKIGILYPVDPYLKVLLDKVLTDPRWDLKFIGMQIIIEGLALAAFHTVAMTSMDPLLKELIGYVIKDESRHVAFGVTFLEEFVKALPKKEIEDRAMFAYEACVVMKERLIPTRVYEEFGWDAEESRRLFLGASFMEMFSQTLFNRVIPNLKKIGLLTDTVRPLYEKLGVLLFENEVHDGEINWAVLEAPVKETA